MIIDRVGNLFDSTAEAIGHGVNCKGAMGSGIAVQFKERYPEMYYEYRDRCHDRLLAPGKSFVWYSGKDDRYIANLASQDFPGANAAYAWVTSSLMHAVGYLYGEGVQTLAIPAIGAGIGGLEWDLVYLGIMQYFDDCPIDIEVWLRPGSPQLQILEEMRA